MARYDLTSKNSINSLRTSIAFLKSNRLPFIDIDDMLQSVCVKYLENPDGKSTLYQTIIDVLRDEYGRSDNVFYSVRAGMSHAVGLDSIKKEDLILTDAFSKTEARHDIMRLLDYVEDPIAKQIITDIYFFDNLRCEIAEKLGLSAAWIGVKEQGAIDDMMLAIEEESQPDTIQTVLYTN